MSVSVDNAVDAAKVLKAFLEPFADGEIKVRAAMVKGNRCLALHYIDARCVMDRLDEVVGMDRWKDEYTVLTSGEVECRLSVKIAGEWITKADVGGQSEQPDDGDKMKAAYSDALKRAAVKFGIGRFLYRLPQQWMDYDPQKRQIIRPQAKAAPAASKPAAQAPSKPPLSPGQKTGPGPTLAEQKRAFHKRMDDAISEQELKAIGIEVKKSRLSEEDKDDLAVPYREALDRLAVAKQPVSV